MEEETPVQVDYHVYILKTRKHCYRTRPPRVVVEEGDRVIWNNKLHRPVKLTFVSGNPFGFGPDPIIINPLSDFAAEVGARRGKYAYTVETIEDSGDGQYADGDSDPIIDVL